LQAHSVSDAGSLEFTLLSSSDFSQLALSGPNPPTENNNSPYLVSQPEQHEVGIEFPITASSAPSQSMVPTAAPILTYQR